MVPIENGESHTYRKTVLSKLNNLVTATYIHYIYNIHIILLEKYANVFMVDRYVHPS